MHLKGRLTDRERLGREQHIPPTSLLPKRLLTGGLYQPKARSLEIPPGLSHGGRDPNVHIVLCFFPRELDPNRMSETQADHATRDVSIAPCGYANYATMLNFLLHLLLSFLLPQGGEKPLFKNARLISVIHHQISTPIVLCIIDKFHYCYLLETHFISNVGSPHAWLLPSISLQSLESHIYLHILYLLLYLPPTPSITCPCFMTFNPPICHFLPK